MNIVNREQAQVIETPHRSELRPLIDRTTSDVQLCSLAEESLPVGHRVKRHEHYVTEEIYYILHGVGTLEVAGETKIVRAGDAIFIPVHHAHTLENTGDEPMRLLLVCGAAYTTEDHHMLE